MDVSMKIIFTLVVLFNLHHTNGMPRPIEEMADLKAVYKSGELLEFGPPITLDGIKSKLKETGIFDWTDPTLTDRQKKEMKKLFEAVQIMTTSRNRQPSNVQNMFSSLRVVERVVKKQLKEGQISEDLASKFHWEKLNTRQ